MDVQFTDSFWKSLKTMNRHQTWWYKTYELFRYKIPYFFENVWYFRNHKLPEVCVKVKIEHTYSEGTHMSEEERNKRYMILDKYKTK